MLLGWMLITNGNYYTLTLNHIYPNAQAALEFISNYTNKIYKTYENGDPVYFVGLGVPINAMDQKFKEIIEETDIPIKEIEKFLLERL